MEEKTEIERLKEYVDRCVLYLRQIDERLETGESVVSVDHLVEWATWSAEDAASIAQRLFLKEKNDRERNEA